MCVGGNIACSAATNHVKGELLVVNKLYSENAIQDRISEIMANVDETDLFCVAKLVDGKPLPIFFNDSFKGIGSVIVTGDD